LLRVRQRQKSVKVGRAGGGQIYAVLRDLGKRVFVRQFDDLPNAVGAASDKLYVVASGRHGTPNV
jgi:hypothetical protein